MRPSAAEPRTASRGTHMAGCSYAWLGLFFGDAPCRFVSIAACAGGCTLSLSLSLSREREGSSSVMRDADGGCLMCLGCCSIGRVNGSSSTTRFTQTRDENRAALLSDSNKTGLADRCGYSGIACRHLSNRQAMPHVSPRTRKRICLHGNLIQGLGRRCERPPAS